MIKHQEVFLNPSYSKSALLKTFRNFFDRNSPAIEWSAEVCLVLASVQSSSSLVYWLFIHLQHVVLENNSGTQIIQKSSCMKHYWACAKTLLGILDQSSGVEKSRACSQGEASSTSNGILCWSSNIFFQIFHSSFFTPTLLNSACADFFFISDLWTTLYPNKVTKFRGV